MKPLQLFAIAVLCSGLGACGSLSEFTQGKKQGVAEQGEIRPESWSPIPRCVRLSMDRDDDSTKTFYGDYKESLGAHLLSKGYKLTEDGQCGFVFSSSITQNSRGFFGFFSRVILSAKATLKDVKGERTLWSSNATVDFSDGALPFSLVGISTGIYKASESMSREKELMAIDSLSRKLLGTLPYLPTEKTPPVVDQNEFTDIDKWLDGIAEIDRPQALLKLVRGAYGNELKDKAYIRLCRLQNTAVNRRQWALFKASLGEHENAINVLLADQSVSQQDPESQFLLGRLYTALVRYSDADQAYLRASSLNAENPLYWEGLAYVNTKSKNYPRALAAYEKILQINPSHFYAHMNMAEIQLTTGQVPEAIAHLSNAADVSFAAKDLGGLQKILSTQVSVESAGDDSLKSERDILNQKINAYIKQLGAGK